MGQSQKCRAGFTLIELLVVIAIIAILAAILMPALASAKIAGGKAACLSNLREIAVAIHAYSDDFSGKIPWGPKAGPYLNPGNFYPSTGAPTTLLSLQSGQPVALGLMLNSYLANNPKVLFCPGNDQPIDVSLELSRVGIRQAEGSYFYRHGGKTALSDVPDEPPPQHIHLDNLGTNRLGGHIRALAMDSQYVVSPDMLVFGVKKRTHHRERVANVAYADGHVSSKPNRDRRYTVDMVNATGIYRSFDFILQKFEAADAD